MKRNGTIELRLLEGTFNFEKMFFWLLINLALIEKALSNPQAIYNGKDKIFLDDVVKETYPKDIAEILCSFIKERKRNFNMAKVNNDLQMDNRYFGDLDVYKGKQINWKI